MPLVIANVGECELLDKMLKDALSTDENYTLKLFKSNTTPSASSVAGDFSEADFTGYSAKTLTRAGWNAATTVSGKAKSVYGTTQSWTCGATGNTIYGYYIVGATSGTLFWAERFSAAKTLNDTDVLNITPNFTFNSEN
jgi:hypothetical protein